jgi:hypothetical protein
MSAHRDDMRLYAVSTQPGAVDIIVFGSSLQPSHKLPRDYTSSADVRDADVVAEFGVYSTNNLGAGVRGHRLTRENGDQFTYDCAQRGDHAVQIVVNLLDADAARYTLGTLAAATRAFDDDPKTRCAVPFYLRVYTPRLTHSTWAALCWFAERAECVRELHVAYNGAKGDCEIDDASAGVAAVAKRNYTLRRFRVVDDAMPFIEVESFADANSFAARRFGGRNAALAELARPVLGDGLTASGDFDALPNEVLCLVAQRAGTVAALLTMAHACRRLRDVAFADCVVRHLTHGATRNPLAVFARYLKLQWRREPWHYWCGVGAQVTTWSVAQVYRGDEPVQARDLFDGAGAAPFNRQKAQRKSDKKASSLPPPLHQRFANKQLPHSRRKR